MAIPPASAREILSALQLSSFEPLVSAARALCPTCGASRKLYCYDCYLPLGLPEGAMPQVALPLDVIIIKHPLELQSKSTAVHAKLLSPVQVNIYPYPELPLLDPASTVLAFPGKDAIDVAELDISQIKSIVFVDSTWYQAKSIVRDPRLSGLRTVKLSEMNTAFWRVQAKKPTTHLATVEAIYYFFRQTFPKFFPSLEYDGRFDNLLYLFAYTYQVIQNHYRGKGLRDVEGLKLNQVGYIDYRAADAAGHDGDGDQS